MEKKAKLIHIYQLLKKEYPDAVTFLKYSNPFELLIAVILSARTTDAQVNRITPELFGRYGTPMALMNADEEDVKQIIYSTGFYKMKAKNIIQAAGMLVTAFQGKVPEGMDDLLMLSGVGRKSANVVRAHCFNKPAVIVDTHFSRVVKRIGLTESSDPVQIEKDIISISKPDLRTEFSMMINVHGRNRCFAGNPDCIKCIIRSECVFSHYN